MTLPHRMAFVYFKRCFYPMHIDAIRTSLPWFTLKQQKSYDYGEQLHSHYISSTVIIDDLSTPLEHVSVVSDLLIP